MPSSTGGTFNGRAGSGLAHRRFRAELSSETKPRACGTGRLQLTVRSAASTMPRSHRTQSSVSRHARLHPCVVPSAPDPPGRVLAGLLPERDRSLTLYQPMGAGAIRARRRPAGRVQPAGRMGGQGGVRRAGDHFRLLGHSLLLGGRHVWAARCRCRNWRACSRPTTRSSSVWGRLTTPALVRSSPALDFVPAAHPALHIGQWGIMCKAS